MTTVALRAPPQARSGGRDRPELSGMVVAPASDVDARREPARVTVDLPIAHGGGEVGGDRDCLRRIWSRRQPARPYSAPKPPAFAVRRRSGLALLIIYLLILCRGRLEATFSISSIPSMTDAEPSARLVRGRSSEISVHHRRKSPRLSQELCQKFRSKLFHSRAGVVDNFVLRALPTLATDRDDPGVASPPVSWSANSPSPGLFLEPIAAFRRGIGTPRHDRHARGRVLG